MSFIAYVKGKNICLLTNSNTPNMEEKFLNIFLTRKNKNK